jgi:CheY-like chemotaxis protein
MWLFIFKLATTLEKYLIIPEEKKMFFKMLNKIMALTLVLTLAFEQSGFAQVAGPMGIPAYINGYVSPDKFRPLQLRSLTFDQISNDFNFYLDKGDLQDLKPGEIRENTAKLSEYFQIGLRLPNSAFWVNLRPDAQDQIIDPWLEKTDLGKVMLEADLQLKKDMANFTSPQTPEGKNYWEGLYAKAEELFGQSEITIPTLTRPWIVPGEILIRETKDNAYIYKATLKVMLEQDYLKDAPEYKFDDPRAKTLNDYSTELIRRDILPKLTREVNSSKKYASLRQVYYSLILAQWFKRKALFQGLNTSSAQKIDSFNLEGLTSRKSWSKDIYFKAYKKSFAKGEYRLQEAVNRLSGTSIRQYTSGGLKMVNMNIARIDPLVSNPEVLQDGGLSDTLKSKLIAVRNGNIINPNQKQLSKDGGSDNSDGFIKRIVKRYNTWVDTKLPEVRKEKIRRLDAEIAKLKEEESGLADSIKRDMELLPRVSSIGIGAGPEFYEDIRETQQDLDSTRNRLRKLEERRSKLVAFSKVSSSKDGGVIVSVGTEKIARSVEAWVTVPMGLITAAASWMTFTSFGYLPGLGVLVVGIGLMFTVGKIGINFLTGRIVLSSGERGGRTADQEETNLDGGTQVFYIDEMVKKGINVILESSEKYWQRMKDEPLLNEDLEMLDKELWEIKNNAVEELVGFSKTFGKDQVVSYLNIMFSSPDSSAYARELSIQALVKLERSSAGKQSTAQVINKDGGDIKEIRVLVLKDLLQRFSKNSSELKALMMQTSSDYNKQPSDVDIERLSSVIQKSLSVLPEEKLQSILLQPAESRDTRKRIDWSSITVKQEIGPEDASLVLELSKNYLLRLRRKFVEFGLGYDEVLPEHFLALARSSKEDVRDFILEMLSEQIAPEPDQIERVRKVLTSYLGGGRMGAKELKIVKAAGEYFWLMFARKFMFGSEDRQNSLFTAPWALVVDDSISSRTKIAVSYRSLGFRVFVEESVADAKQTYEWGRENGIVFDLVSTDRDMPGESGIEFAQWIKGRTPVILLSGGISSDEPVAVDQKAIITAKISKINYDQVLPGVLKELNIFRGDPMSKTNANVKAGLDGGKPVDLGSVKATVENNIALFNKNPQWLKSYLLTKSDPGTIIWGSVLPSGEIFEITSQPTQDVYSKQMKFMVGNGYVTTAKEYSQEVLENESLIKKILEDTFDELDKKAGKDAFEGLKLVKAVRELAAEQYLLRDQFIGSQQLRGVNNDNDPDGLKEKMALQKKELFKAAIALRKVAEIYNVPTLKYDELVKSDVVVSYNAKESYWYLAISAAEARVQHEYEEVKQAFIERRFFSVNKLQEILELVSKTRDSSLLDGGTAMEQVIAKIKAAVRNKDAMALERYRWELIDLQQKWVMEEIATARDEVSYDDEQVLKDALKRAKQEGVTRLFSGFKEWIEIDKAIRLAEAGNYVGFPYHLGREKSPMIVLYPTVAELMARYAETVNKQDGGKREDNIQQLKLDIANLSRKIDELTRGLAVAPDPKKIAVQRKINEAGLYLEKLKDNLKELEASDPETWDSNRIEKGKEYSINHKSDYLENKYGLDLIVIIEGPHQQLMNGWYGDIAERDPNDKKNDPLNIIMARAYLERMRQERLRGDDPNNDEVFVGRIYYKGMVYRELVHKSELKAYDPGSFDGGTKSFTQERIKAPEGEITVFRYKNQKIASLIIRKNGESIVVNENGGYIMVKRDHLVMVSPDKKVATSKSAPLVFLVQKARVMSREEWDSGAPVDTGGVDFRALPAVVQPMVNPAAGVNPAGLISLRDLDRQWSDIQSKIYQGEMPYQEIKKYASACCARQDAAKQLERVFEGITNILKMEEDRALLTNPQLKEILACLG